MTIVDVVGANHPQRAATPPIRVIDSVGTTVDRIPAPAACAQCGRSPQRHALYYLPHTRQFIGRRTCESIDDIEARWLR